MSDDAKTRKVKAVRRKAPVPITEQLTRPVKAVRRKPPRAPEDAPTSAGLLPRAALKETQFRIVETAPGIAVDLGWTTNRYQVQLSDDSAVLYTPQKRSPVPGWGFEVRDLDEVLRFSLKLSLRKLVFFRMTVSAPDGVELGRIEQRFSLYDVKFEVLEPDGTVRFTIHQPADVHLRYEVWRGQVCVAQLERERITGLDVRAAKTVVAGKWRVDLLAPRLDARERVLLLSAAIFLDRVFFTGKRG